MGEQTISLLASGELERRNHMAIGFGSALLLDVPLGLLMRRSRLFSDALLVPIELLRPIAGIAWIPIGLFMFGISEARAEELGFAGLWTRGVPLPDPNFGDLGQVYDPWMWLGWIAAHTSTIALATGSMILPLRHPFHTAKASASVDQLTGGRFVLGVASGDRPVEFPAFGVDWHHRDILFRENLAVIRKVLMEEFPSVQSSYGAMLGAADLVPKPVSRLSILITGSSRQSFEWIAAHAVGWILSTRPRAAGGAGRKMARSGGGRVAWCLQALRAVPLCRSGHRWLDAGGLRCGDQLERA